MHLTNTQSSTRPGSDPLLKVCFLTLRDSTADVVIAAQLPQTAYQSLLTPYAFIGLGRTNNYVEKFYVGATLHSEAHYMYLEGVIPNSKVAIWPPTVRDGQIQGDWKRELYLRPGQWIPLVTLTVVLATGLMAIIVLVLRLNEKVRGIFR